ncbi:NAD(P)H-binding protein, partial [uncultured Salegentibacter sp.]|uniref:NAD(P)H-binding protein n=1 Tax=uncultured Salegentibacter sp. TaxID=259320 RepID=UPI0030DC9A1D
DYNSLIQAFKNVDAVISCIGPADDFKPGTLMSEGTANIVQACEVNNIEKFAMMSGIIQSEGKKQPLINRLVLKLIKAVYRKVVSDKIIAEKVVQKSSLQWVIVRPAGLQSKGKIEELVKAAPIIAVSPLKRISVKTCAFHLVRAVEDLSWNKQIIHVGK